MRLLALDQASRTSGYSIFEDGKLIHHGKFTFTDTDFGVRLFKIRNQVESIIQEYKIDEVIFEDIQLQNNRVNNVETFKKLAEVYGVIDELLTELKLPHDAVISTVWKSALGIKGKDSEAQKAAAAAWAQKTFNVKATQDEYDAICIGAYKNYVNKNDWSD